MCYLTWGHFHLKEEPRGEHARSQLNELPVIDLKCDNGKYKMAFGGSPFTAYFTYFRHKNLVP